MATPENTDQTRCPEQPTDDGIFVTVQNVHNLVFDSNDTRVGSVVTARCKIEEYVLPGSNMFFCTHNGTWFPEPSNCTAPDVESGLSGYKLILVVSWAGFGGGLILVLLLLGLGVCIHKASKKKPKQTVDIGMSPRSASDAPGIELNAGNQSYTNHAALPSMRVGETWAGDSPYYSIQRRREGERFENYDDRIPRPEMDNRIPRPDTIYCPEDHPNRYRAEAINNVYVKKPYAENDGSWTEKF